ncbi:hypothetical protein ACQ9LF_12920 [Anaerohalosphaeraceae bacterium U12dextr]|jgi:hypothetical protein
MKEALDELILCLRRRIEPYVSYDEVQQWPPGQLEQLMQMRVVVPTMPAKEYTCRECHGKECGGISLTVQRNTQTGQDVGMFLCREESGAGLKQVSLDHLRRWEIIPDKKKPEPVVHKVESVAVADVPEQKLSPADEKAYQSYCIAEQSLGKCTDKEAYEWLEEHGDPDYELPSFDTWHKYVRNGRKYHNTNKNTRRAGRKTSAPSVKDDPALLSQISNRHSKYPVESEKAD